MAATETELCNEALAFLGANLIASLADATDEARRCKQLYPGVRDAVLRQHPWRCAIVRVSLALDATAPVYGWANKFRLPADYLRLLEVQDDTEHQVEGNFVLSDAATLNVRYIRRITNTTEFDALLSKAIGYRLAADLASSLTGLDTKLKAALTLYSDAITEARAVNLMEGSPLTMPEGSWVENVRNG